MILFQEDQVWISCGRVKCRNGGAEVDVVEVFVEVDSISCMSGGAGERKHEVGDGLHPRVKNAKATSIQAELWNEKGVMREDWDANDVGWEAGNDVVGCHSEGAIPISPVMWGAVSCVVVVENIATQEVGYLLDESLGKESEFSICGLVIAVDMMECSFGIMPVGCCSTVDFSLKEVVYKF